MSILENSLITLENGDKIDVRKLKLDNDIVLTCKIAGLNPKSVNKEAIAWSKINPIIEKKMARVSKKWKENIDKYIVVNNKLKLSLDTIILFKDFEGETTWGYSKSLRKRMATTADRFEYEEIKSIKRVKENVDTICLSVHSFSYYFCEWLFSPQYYTMWCMWGVLALACRHQPFRTPFIYGNLRECARLVLVLPQQLRHQQASP